MFPPNNSANTSPPFLYENHFHLKDYADNYYGRAKVLRLKAIAENCGKAENERLELESLKLAYDEAKLGDDIELFKKVAQKINGRMGEDYLIDVAWCTEKTTNWRTIKTTVIKNANQTHDDFLVEARYRNNAIDACKEAVDIHYSHGEIEDARNWNSQILRCCGESDDIRRWECIIRGLILLLETKDYTEVKDVAVREHDRCIEFVDARSRENLNEDFADFIYASAMNLANAIALLLEGNYSKAADELLDTDAGLGNNYSSLLASHDIGTYGVLCALSVSEDPHALKTRLSKYSDVGDYLDSSLGLKELLDDFYSRNYISFFRRLDHLGLWLSFDIYMSKHFKPICKMIRQNCIIEYVQAFSSITVASMADTLNMSVEGLKDEVIELIQANKLQARIDTSENLLYAPKG